MAAGAERAKKSFLIPNCSYFSLCLAGWLRQPEISPKWHSYLRCTVLQLWVPPHVDPSNALRLARVGTTHACACHSPTVSSPRPPSPANNAERCPEAHCKEILPAVEI